jgi:hypothetical protein
MWLQRGAGVLAAGCVTMLKFVMPDCFTLFISVANAPVQLETNDVRAHGKDERPPVGSFYKGVQFWHDCVRMLTGGE